MHLSRWSIPNNTINGVRQSLNEEHHTALEAADYFFASLRIATGFTTGYAQVLFAPKKWATDFYCDLPPVYGATYRRYPISFDRYGWVGTEQASITKEDLIEIKTIYNLLLDRTEERVSIATKRLNSCMTRDDAVDAILDATIGLEALLGDQGNQALSYKLRLRAAALTKLNLIERNGDAVFKDVKRLYDIRSQIVHGAAKRNRKVVGVFTDERYTEERGIAIDMLRFVLKSLLVFPKYLEPSEIDRELLLRSSASAGQNGDG